VTQLCGRTELDAVHELLRRDVGNASDCSAWRVLMEMYDTVLKFGSRTSSLGICFGKFVEQNFCRMNQDLQTICKLLP